MADTQLKLQFLDLAGLSVYDGHIKQLIADGDAASIKGVALSEDGKKLLFYKEEPITGATAKYEVELPETDLSHLMTLVTGATAGNIAEFDENGQVVDSGKKVEDFALKSEFDELKSFVGEIPEGSKATTVTGYAKELADEIIANAYDDTALSQRVTETENAIKTLNGDENTEGSVKKAVADAKAAIDADVEAVEDRATELESKVSTLIGEDANKSVRTIANEELAKQLIPENAAESLNTLQEIADWIQAHPNDAAAMNTAITALQNLVGTLPEGVTATTIVGYIQELVAAEQARAEGVEASLDERLQAVETQLGSGEGSVTDQIADAKQEAIDAAAQDATAKADAAQAAAEKHADDAVATLKGTDADAAGTETVFGALASAEEAMEAAQTAQDEVDDLREYVGEFTPVGTETTVVGYVDAKIAQVNSDNSALGERVTANEQAIAAINDETNGILAKAKAHADEKDAETLAAANAHTESKVKELADGQVATNTAAIATNAGNIATNTSNIAANAEAIAQNASDIEALQTGLSNITPIPTADIEALFA